MSAFLPPIHPQIDNLYILILIILFVLNNSSRRQMKVKSSIKKMCEGCIVTQYNKKYYVKCKLNPRHKQRQRFSTIKEFPSTGYLQTIASMGLKQQNLRIRDIDSLLIWIHNHNHIAGYERKI